MNRVFSIGRGMFVPDGTIVYPFLDSKDPFDLLSNISIAVGEIEPKHRSKIHIHPFATLLTWVIAGTYCIKMKARDHKKPYVMTLTPEQAVLTKPGTFLQHINETAVPCRVLYIVSPAYLFVVNQKGEVEYEDAVVTSLGWEELASQSPPWTLPELTDVDAIRKKRERLIAQLKARREQKLATAGLPATWPCYALPGPAG